MRKIKFRAWNTGTRRWYTVGQKNLYRSTLIPTADEILMQYTGLKDKNGVEIYEGDLLQVYAFDTSRKGPIRQVIWNTETSRYNGIPLTHSHEVIGNIYENPELLNGEQNNE